MLRSDRWLCTLLFSGAMAACVTNHDALERRPDAGAGAPNGGRGGSAGFMQFGGNGGDAAATGGRADDEPPGTSKLTLVNGVVDAPRVAVCLAKLDDEGNVTPFGEPLGEEPLAYGRSLVLSAMTDIDVERETLQLFLIAGELGSVAGLDCQAAIQRARVEEGQLSEPSGVAGEGGATNVVADIAAGRSGQLEGGAPGDTQGGASGSADGGAAGAGGSLALRSRLRVRGLPAIPAGLLGAGRSLLLVANGCLGGATYTSANAESYCGKGYGERQPTVSAVLVSLSRAIAFERVGMQVVNASLASGPVEVRSRPPFPSQDAGLAIVGNLVFGQVAPRPASLSNSVLDYGIAKRHVLQVSDQASMPFIRSWEQAMELGGLSELQNGVSYALVLSGPRGALPAVPELWNAAALTVIAADPPGND